MSEHSADRSGRGVYGISVAAELSGVGEQSLRLYEQRGLLTPARTTGGTRRYSDDDLARYGASPTCSPPGSTWPASVRSWTCKTATSGWSPTTPH